MDYDRPAYVVEADLRLLVGSNKPLGFASPNQFPPRSLLFSAWIDSYNSKGNILTFPLSLSF